MLLEENKIILAGGSASQWVCNTVEARTRAQGKAWRAEKAKPLCQTRAPRCQAQSKTNMSCSAKSLLSAGFPTPSSGPVPNAALPRPDSSWLPSRWKSTSSSIMHAILVLVISIMNKNKCSSSLRWPSHVALKPLGSWISISRCRVRTVFGVRALDCRA